MSADAQATAGGDGVHVTDHAQRRYLERVDAGEPYPASAIRELWRAIRSGAADVRAVQLVYTAERGRVRILTVCTHPGDEPRVMEA